MNTADIVIIGAGPAGLTAGLYAARAGAKTIILEGTMHGGQMNLTPDIANFPAQKLVGGAELGEIMLEQTTNAGAEIMYASATDVDFEKRIVTTEDGEISYKSLVIATGASPRRLGLPNEEKFIGAGVHFCGLCDGAFYKHKHVVVVGGGNHAVEEAIYLHELAKSVTMVVITEDFSAQKTLVKQLNKHIKVHFNNCIRDIIGENKITAVRLKDGTEIETDGIFIAIGRMPNSELFRGKLELRDNYIVVGEKQQTSVAGVFAAGDVMVKSVRQVVTACADGAIAAINAWEAAKNL